MVDVTCETKFGTGLQHASHQRQRPLRDETPLVLATLGPRVGIKQINPSDRLCRQTFQHFERIGIVKPDVAKPLALDRREHFRHAVDKGLTADEPNLGMRTGLHQQMLAPTEPDFDMEVTDRNIEQSGGRQITRRINPKPW